MKGLSFIPEMALAALAGTKTQTRRIIVPQPPAETKLLTRHADVWQAQRSETDLFTLGDYRCDYLAFERRCLLTTWSVANGWDNLKPKGVPANIALFWHAGMGEKPLGFGKNRPGRFLPNHLRHLMPVFEIVRVRAERVQSITEADAKAEGAPAPTGRRGAYPAPWATAIPGPCDYRESFQKLWDSINAKRGPGKAKEGYGWKFNPWVWRVEFRRVGI